MIKKILKNKNKGITLIALVITIVILIILAAVTMNTVLGENGIIARAKQAAFESKKAEYKERLGLTILDEKLDRADKEKEEPLVRSLANRIQDLDFVKENGTTLLKDDTELQSGDNEELANKIEVETKEGYIFIVLVDNNTLEASISDEVIRESKNYTITYKSNISGDSQADIVESIRAGRSAKTKLANVFTRIGYTLIGWSENSSDTVGEYAVGDSIEQVTKDITLYAVWGQDIVYITFDSNGGDNTMEAQPVQKGIETSITLNNISKTGHTFDSWNTAANGSGTRYTDNAKITITEDTTLYAQWNEVLSSTLTFNSSYITQGTTATLNGTSGNGIANITLKVGNTTIFTENISGNQTSYSRTIGISDMTNLSSLTFNGTDAAVLTVTSKSDANRNSSSINVTNLTIGNATQLDALATAVNSDNTFAGKTIYVIDNITTNSNFKPIGYALDWMNNYHCFSGTFDGNYKTITISGFSIPSDLTCGLALFGYCNGATIKNVRTVGNINLSSVELNGVAGICSFATNNTNISKCKNTINITSNSKTNGIGGVCTYALNSTITECHNDGNLINGLNIGGIVNYINASSITYCYNTGNISGEDTTTYWGTKRGGIVSAVENSASISYCYNTGNISCSSQKNAMAGIISWISENSSITANNIYNCGTISNSAYNKTASSEWGSSTNYYVGYLWGYDAVGIAATNKDNYSPNTIQGWNQETINTKLTNKFLYKSGSFPWLDWELGLYVLGQNI